MNHQIARPKASNSTIIQRAGKSAAASAREFRAPQPDPFLPSITKTMVRKLLRGLYENIVLDHQPPTAGEWVLAEWYVAQALRFSPFAPAPFALETVRRRSAGQHVAVRASARRH